jgi:hypothetical protein
MAWILEKKYRASSAQKKQCTLIIQKGFILIVSYMLIGHFDRIHPLYYSFLSPPILNDFNRFSLFYFHTCIWSICIIFTLPETVFLFLFF